MNKLEINLIKINSYLFFLLPVAIVTGPFLTDLIIVIMAISFLYISIKERQWHYYNNYFSYIFLFFYLYINIRSIFSVDVILSLEHTLFYIRYLLFVLCVCHLIDKNPKLSKFFLNSLLLVFTILIVDAYIQFFFSKNIFGWENTINERLSGLFRDKYVLGQYLVRLYPVLLGLIFFLNEKNKAKLKLSICLLLFIDILVFVTGDRTAFLLMTMSTILILILVNQYKLLRFIVFLVSLIFIALILFQSDKVYDRVIDESIKESGINNSENTYIISSTHQDIYFTAINMFLDNKLFGQGAKTFRVLCSDDKFRLDEGCSTHPHNIYLQNLSELGIIGTLPILLFFLFLIYLFFRQFLSILMSQKSKYLEDYEIFFYIALFITLWPLAPSLSFFSNHFSPIYYLPIPFLLSYSRKLSRHYLKK